MKTEGVDVLDKAAKRCVLLLFVGAKSNYPTTKKSAKSNRFERACLATKGLKQKIQMDLPFLQACR